LVLSNQIKLDTFMSLFYVKLPVLSMNYNRDKDLEIFCHSEVILITTLHSVTSVC
jgi:hypothetical protein